MRGIAALILILAPAFVSAQDFFTLKGHGGPIMGIAVSPDGQVATASFDNSVGLWKGRTPHWLEGHAAAVTTLDFTQAPAVLSGGDDFRVLLQHRDLPEPITVTRHKGKVTDIALSSDQTLIATASWDGSIRLTTPVTLLQTVGSGPVDFLHRAALSGHRSGVNAVGFAPDGTLFSASSDGTVRVWEGAPGQMTSRVVANHGFGINELIVTKDWLAYGAVDGGTRIVDHDGREIADFTLDRRPILAMDYHPETHQIAVGDGEGHIMVIDTSTWSIARDFRAARRGPVWAVAFSPDGQTLYAGGLDDAVYAWPVALLEEFEPGIDGARKFLQKPETMENGERQFARKCSICHSLTEGSARRAGPTLYNLFGRPAGTVSDYRYSDILDGSDIIWNADSINALFDLGPDHYIPGSKMPMQRITDPADRADLIAYLRRATQSETD